MIKQYAQRDVRKQGNYFTRHMSAMTGEELHDKADIAAELAHRDQRIDALEDALKEALREVRGFESRTGIPQFSGWIQRVETLLWRGQS